MAVGRLRPPFADDVAALPEAARPATPGWSSSRCARTSTSSGAHARPRLRLAAGPPTASALDSVGFARFLEQRRSRGRDLCFVVGGPFGLRARATSTTASRSGAMTLPHQLARVVLLEQLFRAHKIIAGEPYHY